MHETMSNGDAHNPENFVEVKASAGSRSRSLNKISSTAGRFSEKYDDNVEITLEDSIAPDPEATLLERSPKKHTSSLGLLARTASLKIRELSRDFFRLPSQTKLDAEGGWKAIEDRFNELAVDEALHRDKFGECIGMKPGKEFAENLFDALARRRNITADKISKEELREFWDQIANKSIDSRLQFYYDMVDKHGAGKMTEDELIEIISSSASANNLPKIKEDAGKHASLIMEELDPDNLGFIEIYQLEMQLLQAQSQSVGKRSTNCNFTSLLPNKQNSPRRWYQETKYFLKENWKRVWVMALWMAICIGLFTYKFIQYRHRAVFHVMGYCVCVAKGSAETLKFNMALTLLSVCRNTITLIRSKTKLGALVPFDDNIKFHKVIAIGITVGVGLHAISHLTCDFPRLLHTSDERYEPMKPFFGDTKPNSYWWFLKGIEGWTGVVMVVLMSIAFTMATPIFRRGSLELPKIFDKIVRLKFPKKFNKIVGFNAFWYSHHLLVIVYTLLIIHGYFLYLTKKWYKKTTWMYLAIPMIIYATERLVRVLRSKIQPVKLLNIGIYNGNVLALYMSKPPGFGYCSGQYIYVNCAAVSAFQWHPFSITSAPNDDYISVHIRAVGDWTKEMKSVFSGHNTSGKGGLQPSSSFHSISRNIKPKSPRIAIDGPYGAPAQDYKKYEIVLLVGQGIGATPFISILKDILHNTNDNQGNSQDIEQGDSRNCASATSEKLKKSFKTRRAYFYWVTKEIGSYQWFENVMNEVAEADKKGVIELHNHCTGVEGEGQSALITILQSLKLAKDGVDVVSGSKVKTYFGRPDWPRVYQKIEHNHKNKKIGVFHCGQKELGKILHDLALEYSRTPTKFDFHKENF